MRILLRVFLLASLAVVSPLSAQPCGSNDSIAVVPAEPTAAVAITLELQGSTPTSMAALFDTTHEIQGSTIRVDSNLDPGGFSVPSGYLVDYPLGQLLPGTYTIEHWIQCWQDGQSGEPYLAATTTLTVGGGTVPAIPTLSEAGLGVLLTSLVLAAMALMRRRR
jgi:IPTL-CTERM motif